MLNGRNELNFQILSDVDFRIKYRHLHYLDDNYFILCRQSATCDGCIIGRVNHYSEIKY